MPVQFNRAASSYLRPPGNALVANPAGTWTIAVWIAPQVETGSVRNIFYLNPGNVLQLNGSAAQFIYGGGISSIGAAAAWTGGQYGPWTHLAVTKNGTTEVRYYLNGVYAGNRTTGISADSAQAASIGAYNRASDFYAGHMAALKAWNRVLTDAEIDAESKSLLVTRLTGLAGCFPLIVGPAIWRDWTGQAAELVSVSVGSSSVGIGLPFGAPNQVIGRRDLSVQTVFVSAPVELGVPPPGEVVIDGGRLLDAPLVELAFDGDHNGRYTHVIPRTHIRGVSGSFGFKGIGKFLSDVAKCKLELVNTDGRYTDGGGLRAGMWCKVRLAGSGEVLFTGRVTDITPGYGVSNPVVSVTLEASRDDLRIPARSVLLKNTNTKDASLALLDQTAMQSSGGQFIWDVSVWDGPDVWAGSGASEVRTYGTQWMGLAAAGGYGKATGDMDVFEAVAELMTAEDGRALAGRDNMFELYSRQWLDDAREIAPAYTLTDDAMAGLDLGVGRRYTNDLTLRWTPTRWKAGATVYIYEPDDPASIKPGEFRDFNVRFTVEGSDRVLAAEGLTITITQTGPTVSHVWDGGVKASGGTLRVTCPAGGAAASITKIAVTGTALVANDTAEVRLLEALGRTRYGAKTRVIDAPLIDRETEANARAQREFVMWNEPASFAERATLRYGRAAGARAAAIQWMTLPFATAMDVQSARQRHHGRYLAIGVDWSVAAGGWPVDVTLYLEPTLTGGLLRWDSDGRGWDVGRWA